MQELFVSDKMGCGSVESDNTLFIIREEDGSLIINLVNIYDSLYFNTAENTVLITKFEANKESQSSFSRLSTLIFFHENFKGHAWEVNI